MYRFNFSRLRVSALLTGIIVAPFTQSAELHVDFAATQHLWDGFGAQYVETRHTRDYTVFAQDYGGFKYLTDDDREHIVELVFGDDGLRIGLLKIFADPFHEVENDNDDPFVADRSRFNHTKTTRWIRYFARRGLEKTRARGDDLQVLVGLYGPPGWMTRQGSLLGRDLRPAYEAEVAEYLAVFSRYLRDVEGLPVKFVSMHNEGESPNRWKDDGVDAPSHYRWDYNLWWPEHQIVEFLKVARSVLDAHGLPEVGLTSGETVSWNLFHQHRVGTGPTSIAGAIRDDPAALANLGLITSHGFQLRNRRTGERQPSDPRGIQLLREARPELRAWTTSSTWGDMNVEIMEDARRLIYEFGTNGLIPWAMVHNRHESDKLSPPATTRVSSNANSPFFTNNGEVEVTKAYYFYKQLTRAGQPGMTVAAVTNDETSPAALVAFAGGTTGHPNSFVVINPAHEPLDVTVQVQNAGTSSFSLRVTTDVAYRDLNYMDGGTIPLRDGRIRYTAPARSATTFFALPGMPSNSLP